MKPVIAGVVRGSAIGFYLSKLYLYSLWLPVTAIAVLVSGVIGLACRGRIKPALIVSGALAILYVGIFWIPPELAVRTADSPEEHFRAARAIGSRAQIFGDDERSLEHYQVAAQGRHPEATFVMAAYYDYGYDGFPRDKSEAIAHYRRASELGYQDRFDRLGQLTKQEAEQGGGAKGD